MGASGTGKCLGWLYPVPLLVLTPIFSKLFGRNFCEQQLVLGKFLNTVK